jgi:hypothetical protein
MTGDASQLAAVYRLRAARMGALSEAAARQNVEALKLKAVELSSANAYRPANDKTRPYSRKSPHPPLPPQFVNVQSGQFRAGWQTRTYRQGGDLMGELSNQSPHARFFGGEATKAMIGRPILNAVHQAERRPCHARFVAASRKAIHG